MRRTQIGGSPTAGMNIAQRILHVGGRNNAAGYVEFGSIQAVEALVIQMLRDLTEQPIKRKRIQFPSHLRKMWSGTEVQAWLDANVNDKEDS